jgi:hypothetical protein
MAKKEATEEKVSELEALAVKLEALVEEATMLGEDRVAKSIGNAVKSARAADKQRTAKVKRVGSLISTMKSKGLSDAEIVAQLTSGRE